MRILSQDGFYDLPYDSVWLRFDEDDRCTIYAIPISTVIDDSICDCKLPVMGEYSSEAKARKAMEMLRNFNEVREVRNIPIKSDVIETMFEPLKKLFKIYTDGGGEFLKMDLVKVGDYFHFPTDDEMEV